MVDFSLNLKCSIDEALKQAEEKLHKHFLVSDDDFKCEIIINQHIEGMDIKLEPIEYELLMTKEQYVAEYKDKG